jgi:hypothetical protein
MNIEIVNIVHVDAYWPSASQKFARAAEKCGDDLSLGELWQMCRSGNAFLVVATDESGLLMACVVRFERWTNGMVLRVLTLAGVRIAEWAEPVRDFLASMAKDNEADRVVAEGRDGWAAIFNEPRKLRSTYEMRV